MSGPTRRAATLAVAATSFLATTGGLRGDAQLSPPRDFAGFLQSLWPQAQTAGVRRDGFDALVADLTPDRGLPRSSGGQPEFEKPLQTYYREAVGGGRVARGRALLSAHAAVLADGERRFGVPGGIAVAAWGMESDYGHAGTGTRDILRTVATLAWTRPDRPAFRDEFVAALTILDRGEVGRARLVGSWAGAMGGPQFLPSAYLKYAVSTSGQPQSGQPQSGQPQSGQPQSGEAKAPDIWGNPSDILASVANFLQAQGWMAGEPWIAEVILPVGFDFPTLHAGAADWARLGLRRPDGQPPEGAGDASLFLPAGAGGPAFLLFANYFIIKQYNNSDSYALSFGSLAQRIAGAGPPATPWPARAITLSRSDKSTVQARLAALGLYGGAQDGKFGPKARDAIHAYQKQVGLVPADGFATPALVASLKGR